jgi:hypothetical protein
LGSVDEDTRRPAEPIILSLTVIVSAEGSSPTAPVNNPSPRLNPVAESGAARAAVQVNNDPTRPTPVIIPPSKIRNISAELSDSTRVRIVAPPYKGVMSRDALDSPDKAINKVDTLKTWKAINKIDTLKTWKAINKIDTLKTWKSAVSIMKWVMDTVRPIAAVCQCRFCPSNTELTSILQLNPHAHLAWSILSKIPEVPLFTIGMYGKFTLFSLLFRQILLQQVQRDENIEILLKAIGDAFEFALAEEADTLKNIKPESKQAIILEEMLRCVSECAIFMKSYAEDVGVGMSS